MNCSSEPALSDVDVVILNRAPPVLEHLESDEGVDWTVLHGPAAGVSGQAASLW